MASFKALLFVALFAAVALAAEEKENVREKKGIAYLGGYGYGAYPYAGAAAYHAPLAYSAYHAPLAYSAYHAAPAYYAGYHAPSYYSGLYSPYAHYYH